MRLRTSYGYVDFVFDGSVLPITRGCGTVWYGKFSAESNIGRAESNNPLKRLELGCV